MLWSQIIRRLSNSPVMCKSLESYMSAVPESITVYFCIWFTVSCLKLNLYSNYFFQQTCKIQLKSCQIKCQISSFPGHLSKIICVGSDSIYGCKWLFMGCLMYFCIQTTENIDYLSSLIKMCNFTIIIMIDLNAVEKLRSVWDRI